MKHVPRIYTSALLQEGRLVELDKMASQHLFRVLRLRVGDSLKIFNGQGGEFSAKLVEERRHSAIVELEKFLDRNTESKIKIHLVQAVLKPDKMDIAIQKSVELGVNSITPLLSNFCSIKFDQEHLKKRCNHWQSIATNASEQSGRCFVPTVNNAIRWNEWLLQNNLPGFIADPEHGKSIREYKMQEDSMVFLIGPEGGFSDSECKQAIEKGLLPLSLGQRVLRAETATISGLTLLQFHLGGF